MYSSTRRRPGYSFARALFDEIVDRSGVEVLQMDAYDLVRDTLAEEAGEPYPYNRENIAAHGFPVIEREDRDSSDFRNYWLYMPQFRVLDQNDFVTTMAVFLVLFIFIALICFAAVIVIAFTRCMTIALTNARVYDDLRHLGAPNRYLFRSVKGQVSKVFLVPVIVGTAVISAFYLMIMYFNDNRFTPGEMAGMAVCAAGDRRAFGGALWGIPHHPPQRLPRAGNPRQVKLPRCRKFGPGAQGYSLCPRTFFVYFPPLPAIFLHKVLRPIPSRLAAAD